MSTTPKQLTEAEVIEHNKKAFAIAEQRRLEGRAAHLKSAGLSDEQVEKSLNAYVERTNGYRDSILAGYKEATASA